MFYVSNNETFRDIHGRCHSNLLMRNVYPNRFYSNSHLLCISKGIKNKNKKVFNGVLIKQIDDNQFVTDTFKGVTERFVLKIINENKLNKYYHLNHPNFCDKFYYLMEV